jgi:2-dehydro-3-deoxyphosphogluconate aldolase/(4S)-4-hydroxy-2-oxoglutarate aldolase
MNQVLEQIGELKLVPVIKIEKADDAVPLGRALLAGGLPVAEVTFRTPAATCAIYNLSQTLPEVLVGAGTVLTVDQVRQAVEAGARFIVAPGFNPKVVDYCVQQRIPVVPGVNSPTQIEMGLERGLDVLKFFPAEASGGLKMLKAIAAPYGDVNFMPTGGISPANLHDYLAFDRVVACGGSWLAKTALISAGQFEEISRITREAVELIAAID